MFCSVGVRRDPELLHYFSRELIGGTVAAASLREESIVVVTPVNQEGVLGTTDAAERKITIGSGSQAAWVLGDAGGEQGEIREATPIQRKIIHRTFIEQHGDGRGFRFDHGLRAGDGQTFLRASDLETICEFRPSADIDMQLGRYLGQHASCFHASGVIPWRQQIQSEMAFRIAGGRITHAGAGVHDYDRGLWHASAG